MSVGKMHEDEVETDAALVRRLLAAQFPHWADLPIERVASSGTDNAIYRLGGGLAVRLLRRGQDTGQAAKEARWLPVLAPHLPLAIPVPLALGEPGEGYPYRWSIVPWMQGEDATMESIGDLCDAAREMARFITALQGIDAAGGPAPGKDNFYRGVPLAVLDPSMRDVLRRSQGMVDTDAVTAAWEAALAAPVWEGDPVWVHGDLKPGNVLAAGGRLSAVIDFGCLGVGDPAADLIIAWALFSSESRAVFRASIAVDDATWARGRGWALRAVGALPYYKDTNPEIVASAHHTIAEVLAG